MKMRTIMLLDEDGVVLAAMPTRVAVERYCRSFETIEIRGKEDTLRATFPTCSLHPLHRDHGCLWAIRLFPIGAG